MTDTNEKLRALFLTALMVMSVVAMTTAFTGSALARSGERGNVDTPVTVYIGEENITVRNSSGVAASGSIQFTGTAGAADGSFVSQSNNVDFTDSQFDEGGYSLSAGPGDFDTNSDSVEISVDRAEMNDVTVYLGNSENNADVTDATVPSGTENLTVEAEFNFDTATHSVVEVTDEAGLDITNQVALSGTEITDSGDNILLENIEDLDTGTYTVTVEGADPDDTDLSYASMSVTFTVQSAAAAISLDQTEVTQGEPVIATVTGSPDANFTVRIDRSDLTSTSVDANQVFANTGDIEQRNNSSSSQVAALINANDAGEAQTRINTDFLDDDNTATIEVVESDTTVADFQTDDDDSIDLRVNEREVSMTAPRNIIAGEEFDINGTAEESDTVWAFYRLDDEWIGLTEDNGNYPAADDTDSDGEYSITINSSDNISIPDTYQVGVVAGSSLPSNWDGTSMSRSAFSDATSAQQSLSVSTGSLTGELSTTRIAESETVTVSGTSIGQGDEVWVYVVGPRGGVGWESVSVEDDDTFETDFPDDFSAGVGGGASFDRTGTYTVMVIGAGRNQDFDAAGQNIDIGLSGNNLADEQIAIIEDEFTGAGVDDNIVQMTFVSESPSLDINPVGTNDQVTPGTVTVTGMSNLGSEADIFVDATTQDGDALASSTADFDADTDEWEVELDLSDVDTGQTIRISAETSTQGGEDVTDQRRVEVVSEISTPTPQPEMTPPPSPTPRPSPTPIERTVVRTQERTVVQTRVVERTPTPGQPGFGVGIAIVALLGAAFLALRRRD